MSRIFHIVVAADWDSADDPYEHPSLAAEGFIHFSTGEQIVATTGRYYEGLEGLALIEIDETKLPQPLQWDPAPPTSAVAGQLFPHLYCPLPKAAVTAVHRWEPADQQAWTG